MTEPMTPGWYYDRDGSPAGPLSWEELRGLGASGGLGPTDLVWHDGYADWVPATQVPGLLAAPPRTDPGYPPPQAPSGVPPAFAAAPRRRPWLLPVLISVAVVVVVGAGLGAYFGLSRGDGDLAGGGPAATGTTVSGGTTVGGGTTATGAPVSSTVPSTASSASASIQDLRVVDAATVAELDLGQFHELVRLASERLIARLGGDEAAFCAVLIALDQGHDIHQILTGALNDRLEADGALLSADGSVLAPVRLGDGFIQVSQAFGPGVDVATGATLHFAVLVSHTSTRSHANTKLVAYAFDGGVAINAKLGGTLRTVADIFDHFTPVRERYEELVRQEAREQAFVETTTRIATILAARGYSAEQIIEAIVLDGVTVEDLDDMNSWGIKHTSGVPLRPRFAPVALSEGAGFPEIEKDAPGGFVWADVEVALGAVGQTPSAADLDGIPNGLYLGEVYVISKPDTPVYEIPESIVELEVNDSGITATVEYVTRYSAAATKDRATCIATFRRVYVGQGPVTQALSLTLEPVEQEFISVEGSDCAGVEEFITDLFSRPHTLTLAGTFAGNRFDGNVSATLGVRAAIGQ